jgi:alpha-galactosidase
MRIPHAGWIGLLYVSCSLSAYGQIIARLQTPDTVIDLEAAPTAPRLVSLTVPGQPRWENRASETLIAWAEISGAHESLNWSFNREASEIGDQRVSFVYDSWSPRLRLTWEWRTRQPYGPIEHQIRIENLEGQEIWIPLQDSLAFNWQVDPPETLEHLFVEKGADTPSPVGTHQVALGEGYRWTGTSSTYGDLRADDPREIIPWTLVEKKDTGTGWYAGIEFSGRTRISLDRENSSLQSAMGLNPEPEPSRTCLQAGEVFETPVVFLGGFRGGADGAGNVLRRWVRAVLGNPETWKNLRYPLVVNNSWGGGMDINEDTAGRMIQDSAALGMEMFHVDAGWFRGVGDWYPNPQKFPHGLAALADNAHRHGLLFGLWVDWTQAGLSSEPGALNARDPKVRGWMVIDLPADWKPEPFK